MWNVTSYSCWQDNGTFPCSTPWWKLLPHPRITILVTCYQKLHNRMVVVPNKYAMIGATNQLLPQIYVLNNSIWHNADTCSARQKGTKYFNQCPSTKNSFPSPWFIFDFPTAKHLSSCPLLDLSISIFPSKCPFLLPSFLKWKSSGRSF